MNELNGKVAVVSGASRGIGEACARALDDAGARVVLSARTVSDLDRVASDLSNDPVVLEADLSAPRAGTELAERILAAVGGVDILVNNAGIPMRRKPDELTEEDFDLVFSINVRSLLMLTLGLGPSMIARGGGSVINISSIASPARSPRQGGLFRCKGRRRRDDAVAGCGLGPGRRSGERALPRPDRHFDLGGGPPRCAGSRGATGRTDRAQALGLWSRCRRCRRVLRERCFPLRDRRGGGRGRRHGKSEFRASPEGLIQAGDAA